MKKITTVLLFAIFTTIAVHAVKSPKYIFLFIGDGMGHNHISLTEAALAARNGKIGYEPLNFTQFPSVGFITTNAATRLTTCSAAAGTALATGTKTSIGTIGMNADHTANLESVAVLAKRKGMKVGITTSVSIDHATPAAFYAHAEDRNMSYEIAQWAPRAGFDLYASAGLLKAKADGKRSIYEILADSSYTIVRGAGAELRGNKVFWEQSEGCKTDALPLAIDSKKGDLTLGEITEKSIQFLDNKKGFFLMVEGGQIDWQGHANDAAGIVHETQDFAGAIAKALSFYEAHPTETLIIVTADHETGGLALGVDSRGYDTSLELLFAQKLSKGELERAIKYTKSWQEAKQILTEQMGFWGVVPISAKQELELMIAYERKSENAAKLAIKMLDEKAGIGFTTGSHTATYVPVFAIGAASELFRGRGDNTDIAKKISLLIK